MRIPIEIVTCPAWGARKPRQPITTAGRAHRVIFHHTASHHREIAPARSADLAEAVRYARDVQTFHMDRNGWIDSGHNFLVMRSGIILQGRWLTVGAIEAGHMVVSAHCPGQNGQIGIEHEHLGAELMPDAQREASARLLAWIAWQYGATAILPVDPHSEHFATACPANLKAEIPRVRAMGAAILRKAVQA
jgi:hypothetical protein